MPVAEVRGLVSSALTALSAVVFVSACGADQVKRAIQPQGPDPRSALSAPITQAPDPRKATSATVRTEVLFPRQRAGVDYMQAFGGGRLVLAGLFTLEPGLGRGR